MTGYVPRVGDRIKVELTVAPNGKGALLDGKISAVMVSEMAAERVEWVGRAEPDWQPGDVGQHIETRALYAYTLARHEKGFSWCTVYHTNPHEIGVWHGANALVGQLRKMRLAPADEPLVKLDDLLPHVDEAAVAAIRQEAQSFGYFMAGTILTPHAVIEGTLRVLHDRAEARTPKPLGSPRHDHRCLAGPTSHVWKCSSGFCAVFDAKFVLTCGEHA